MTNGNEPAYPHHAEVKTGQPIVYDSGLTKRELFAAMAMQGMLANPADLKRDQDGVVEFSIGCADALLKRLEETEGD